MAKYAAGERLTVSRTFKDHMEELIREIRMELKRARAKFPSSDACVVALMEEVGELAKACLDESPERIREEAVQTAVMALRVVLDGDHTLDGYRTRVGQQPFPLRSR